MHCRKFRGRVKNFRRTASNTWSTYPKRIVALQKERLRLHVAIWVRLFLQYWTQQKQIQESEYFTQEFKLDINYSSRFIQYPHYPIACCLPHLSTVAHNCHSKSINLTTKRKTSRQKRKRLTAKRITSRQKEKDSKHKENLSAKRKRFTTKFLPYWEDNLIVIYFAMRSWLFFLPWRFSFCREVNSFAVTVLGHRTSILFSKILDFSTCGYSWELAQTLLIWQLSSHRIHGLPRSENAGHFSMSDKWKQSFQNAAFCNCCSSVVRAEERDLISSPVSMFFARSALSTMATIITWEEMKVQVRRINPLGN